MLNLKRIINASVAAIAALGLLSGCGKSTENAVMESEVEQAVDNSSEAEAVSAVNNDITIIYTNDVHSYIANVVKDENENIIGDGLRLSKVAAMVSDMRADGENVLLVDAGDEIQGDIYGAMDEGETIIDIMNAAGYQLATPGNHDFDYGVFQLMKLVDKAQFPYITCNFHSTKSKEKTFADSYVFEIAGKKVAFVGISTPETITSSTPVYFQDESGEFIYTVDGLKDKTDLYTAVQNAIDNVREDADYVIALGHLGVAMETTKKGWDSRTVIANVSGLDAFIDGHSHTFIDGEMVKDKSGKEVLLTQTGYYLNSVGRMTITEDGAISTELIKDYDREDETVAAKEKAWIDEIDEKMSEKAAVLENPMYIGNPEKPEERWIRAMEMNLGDLAADSIYWFFNERIGLGCDIAIQNGGAIRSPMDKGDITGFSLKQVEPFGNMICVITATGQQIVDALEMGASVSGDWDDEWNTPAENGGFIHAAGLSYTIDTSVESSVVTDSDDMFNGVEGDYRVKDVKVYNKETGEYEPIELDKEYQLAGTNYILRNSGNGLSMFADDKMTADYVGLDYVILSEYVKSFSGDGEYPVVNTKNSPLNAYDGYLLDYENPLGAGRINILLPD